MNDYRRQVAREGGFSVDEQGNVVSTRTTIPRIRFITRSVPENWELLDRLVRNEYRLTDEQKERYFSHEGIRDKDQREARMKGDDYYHFLVDSLYASLRVVDFEFHLARKGMVKDTVHTTELDTVYMKGVQAIRDHDYQAALAFLAPYHEYNTAVAYVALDRNASAFEILEPLPRTARVNYMLALVYARRGDDQNAVQHYLDACRQERSFVSRGNLDPEIAALIRKYDLNRDSGETWGDLLE